MRAAALLVAALLLSSAVATSSCPGCSKESDLDFVSFPPFLKDQLLDLFPERRHPPAEYIDPALDPNLRVVGSESYLTITFVHEGAGFRNQLGVFTWDGPDEAVTASSVTKTMIFNDASYDNSCMRTGDTRTVGPFTPGQKVGFFLVQKGTCGGDLVWYSLDHLNLDNKRSMAVVRDLATGMTVLGFEDLRNGDEDYNDLMFTIEYTQMEDSFPTHCPFGDSCNFGFGCPNNNTAPIQQYYFDDVASGESDEDFVPAADDTELAVLSHSWDRWSSATADGSISVETFCVYGYDHIDSISDIISIVDAGTQPTGYCSGHVSRLEDISNHNLCPHAINRDIGWKISFDFRVAAGAAGNYNFKFGVNWGKGGVIKIDGNVVWHDLHGRYSLITGWTDSAVHYDGNPAYFSAHLGAGCHQIEIWGIEDCCDSEQDYLVRGPATGGAWRPLSEDVFAWCSATPRSRFHATIVDGAVSDRIFFYQENEVAIRWRYAVEPDGNARLSVSSNDGLTYHTVSYGPAYGDAGALALGDAVEIRTQGRYTLTVTRVSGAPYGPTTIGALNDASREDVLYIRHPSFTSRGFALQGTATLKLGAAPATSSVAFRIGRMPDKPDPCDALDLPDVICPDNYRFVRQIDVFAAGETDTAAARFTKAGSAVEGFVLRSDRYGADAGLYTVVEGQIYGYASSLGDIAGETVAWSIVVTADGTATLTTTIGTDTRMVSYGAGGAFGDTDGFALGIGVRLQVRGGADTVVTAVDGAPLDTPLALGAGATAYIVDTKFATTGFSLAGTTVVAADNTGCRAELRVDVGDVDVVDPECIPLDPCFPACPAASSVCNANTSQCECLPGFWGERVEPPPTLTLSRTLHTFVPFAGGNYGGVVRLDDAPDAWDVAVGTDVSADAATARSTVDIGSALEPGAEYTVTLVVHPDGTLYIDLRAPSSPAVPYLAAFSGLDRRGDTVRIVASGGAVFTLTDANGHAGLSTVVGPSNSVLFVTKPHSRIRGTHIVGRLATAPGATAPRVAFDLGEFSLACTNECPGGALDPCSGHGECGVATGECTCEPGWSGDACEYDCDCPPPIPEGAECVFNEDCVQDGCSVYCIDGHCESIATPLIVVDGGVCV